MHSRKTISVYILLAFAWLVFAGWQGIEHSRFRDVAYQALLNRAREIVSTIGVVIRSQGRFGMVRQARLEAAIEELTHSTDLRAVMLLNAAGKVVASAGDTVNLSPEDLPRKAPRWDSRNNLVTIVDLVDLGSNAQNESLNFPPAIVLEEEKGPRPPQNRLRPPFPPPGFWGGPGISTQTLQGRPPAFGREGTSRTLSAARGRREPGMRRSGRNAMDISRPFWMDEKQYQNLLKKQGLHGFVLQIPTQAFRSEIRHDLWIRLTSVFIALLAAGGMALTWRAAERMTLLQIRLLRASETNVHLRDLNIAAAGLAHETRNPLNIVRGLAQIISQSAEAPSEVRRKAGIITEEVDRITSRLNDFISYSRSPEPRPAPVSLRAVVQDVQRALESDQTEKEIALEIKGGDLTVEADEPLLRQVVFNLLLNAYQSAKPKGRVQIVLLNGQHSVQKDIAGFEIWDDGPGVPPELRDEIYKPYFTTREEGTGLGLAVVRQIVLAHHWEIEYVGGERNGLPDANGGAGFRISGMRRVISRS